MDETQGHDPVEPRLSAAFDGVRAWEPDAAGRFPAVASRARRRAATARVAGLAALLVAAAGVASLAAGLGRDGSARVVATTGTASQPASPGGDAAPPTTTPPTTATTDTTAPAPASTAPGTPAPSTTAPAPPPTTQPTPSTTTPAREGPPAAYARAKEAEVEAVPGSYCWKDGDSASLCADTGPGWADGAPVLEIATGEIVLFRWATEEQPKSVRADVYTRSGGKLAHETGRTVPVEGGNPCRIALRLPPGEYSLVVGSSWAGGGATHAVSLRVT